MFQILNYYPFLDLLLSFEHSASSPKNDSLSLKWILESKTALPYFIDYLTTINCDSFISFYINIDGESVVKNEEFQQIHLILKFGN